MKKTVTIFLVTKRETSQPVPLCDALSAGSRVTEKTEKTEVLQT